jgi:hypothetical protein
MYVAATEMLYPEGERILFFGVEVYAWEEVGLRKGSQLRPAIRSQLAWLRKLQWEDNTSSRSGLTSEPLHFGWRDVR